MSFRSLVRGSSFFTAGLIGAALALPAQAVTYSVADLGLSATSSSQLGALVPYGLGEQGQVIGAYVTTGGLQSYVTGPDGIGVIPLGLEYGSSSAYGINASGQVTGGGGQPFISNPSDNSVRLLGTLGGSGGAGLAINASGQVTGSAGINEDFVGHAFISGANGGALVDLGTLGGLNSAGLGINDAGQVVGYSEIRPDDYSSHAFVTTANGLRDLGTFIEGGAGSSSAVGINNAGAIVGTASSMFGERAFITDAAGGPLVSLGGLGTSSTAADINDAGQVVGWFALAEGGRRGFLWQGGTMVDINTLEGIAGTGWTLEGATAINERGQIVGIGTFNGGTRVFLLTPVPEPSTWALTFIGLGIAGTVARGRRKR